jgi:hypothetical protein
MVSMMTLFRITLLTSAMFIAQGATAQTSANTSPEADKPDLKLSLMLSPYTHHFNPKPTHRNVFLVGLEREHPNAKLDGLAVFRNSFGQPSIYIYPWGGVYKDIFGVNKLSFKWTAGLIFGYKGEFKNEIPNIGGIAPVVVVALGYEIKPGWVAQINALGAAAAQFQLNVQID